MALKKQRVQLQALLPDSSLLEEQIAHLQANHGLLAAPLIEAAKPTMREPLSSVIPICAAEIHHAVKREHARTCEDVLARRFRLAMVDNAEAQRLTGMVQGVLDQVASTSPINHQLKP